MTRSSSRERILDAAEARARRAGYNGFSFRDVAADVGIKSASVHHHFPGKADLATALAERYRQRAEEALGDPAGLSAPEAVARVGETFRRALVSDDMMCLCGLFGAERDALPAPVQEATAAYFTALIEYLGAAFASGWDGPGPAAIVAQLEGALILARTLRDPRLFETALDRSLTGA